jgi:uncharacterized protein YaiI (UPF0178 family)
LQSKKKDVDHGFRKKFRAYSIHQSGRWYTHENIDELLRYVTLDHVLAG